MKPETIIKKLGGPLVVAEYLGITHGAVCQWSKRGIPAGRCAELEAMAKQKGLFLTREMMRPDIFHRLY
jgi:DNA-binding transcriptional regulator YdaS (Cro superfamily)